MAALQSPETVEAEMKVDFVNLTCQCCFTTNLSLNHIVVCHMGCLTCTACIVRGMKVAVSDRKPFTCFTGCQTPYPEPALQRATTDSKLLLAYANVAARADVEQTGMRFHPCAFCDSGAWLDCERDANRVFDCHECGKSSCRECKKDKHDGPCEPGEHLHEEQETDDFLLTCKCGKRFFRGDGCNKVSCPCRRYFCWICKKHLEAREVGFHFKPFGDPDPTKCPQFGDRDAALAAQREAVRKQEERVRRRAETKAKNSVRRQGEGGTQKRPVCQATLKTNRSGRPQGTPCNFRAVKNTPFCGYHKTSRPPASASSTST